MLELLLCSLLTIFPDYLYRRYRQANASATRSRSFQYGSN